jgi:hypothetical protein
MFCHCGRCQKLVAGHCVACTCGTFIPTYQDHEPRHDAAIITRSDRSEEPHDHRENVPLDLRRAISVTVSTTVGVSTGVQLAWSPIPSSVGPSSVSLYWSSPPFA